MVARTSPATGLVSQATSAWPRHGVEHGSVQRLVFPQARQPWTMQPPTANAFGQRCLAAAQRSCSDDQRGKPARLCGGYNFSHGNLTGWIVLHGNLILYGYFHWSLSVFCYSR